MRHPLPPLLALVFSLLLTACSTNLPAPERFRFALIGDAPYTGAEVPRWADLLASLGGVDAQGRRLAFVLHAGDIKGGAEPCTDALLGERVGQLRRAPIPLLLTPGDNEWTDCHRKAAGGLLPTERLAALRALAWATPTASLGIKPMLVQSQATDPGGLPEHQMFEWNGVVVASVHVVGSKNGLEPWGLVGDGYADSDAQPRADRLAEVQAREAAVKAWLTQAFERARRAQALVLLFQANPGFEAPVGSARREGFEPFIAQVHEGARQLGKPVLLAHGDFHSFLVDRPFPDLPQVQRVQTWGSPNLGHVRVRVLEGHPLRFAFEAVLAP
jgi:hypothetical protein